jgi:hypothetical protein
MKSLYETADRTLAQLLRSALEAEGVPVMVQGEHLTSLQGETPAGSSAQYRVLLSDDEQWPKAERLVADWFAARNAASTEPWTCTHCGERHEPQFELCWKCGEPFDEN